MNYRVKFVIGGLPLYTEWFSSEDEAQIVLRTMNYAGVNVFGVEDEDEDGEEIVR